MARRSKKAVKKGRKKAPSPRVDPQPTPSPNPRPGPRPGPLPNPRPGPGPGPDPSRDPLVPDQPADRPGLRPGLRPRLPDLRPLKPGERPAGEAWPEFDRLEQNLPLLLLPAQLETIFDEQDGRPALKIRIYPDAVSVETLTKGLLPHERDMAEAYWNAPKSKRSAAKQRMLEQLGPQRAAWAAEALRPDATEKAFRATVDEPAEPALLPKRWIVRGYQDGEAVFTQEGASIPKGLTMSPNPDAPEWPDAPKGLPVDANMAWMVDYGRAEDQGMAITVFLDDLPRVQERGLDYLLATGVNELDAKKAAEKVDRLFDAHHFTNGLELLPQGAPTNNTDGADSAWSAGASDVTLFERIIEGPDRNRQSADDGMRLAAALGLGKTSTLARAAGAGRQEETAAQAMNQALWPSVWGEYLRNLLANRSGRALPQKAVGFARGWFRNHVRGGAPLPTLRVGEQPYGVLPVRAAVERDQLETDQDALEDLLRAVRELWLAAVPGIARMDPNLADTGGQDANSPETRLAELFMLQPHAVRFVVRKLTDRRDQGPLLGSITSLVGGFTFLLDVLSSVTLYNGFGNIYRQIESTLETIDEQIAGFEFLRDFAPDYFSGVGDRKTRDNAILLIDIILDVLRDHKNRQAPLDEIVGMKTSGMLHEDIDDPNIFYSLFAKDDDARVFERSLVEAPEPQDAERAESYLENIAQRTLGKAPGGGPPPAEPEFPQGAPLLYQLLNPFASELPAGERPGFVKALRTLKRFPAPELEMRLRETLGLGAYRLDAWFTSLARKRLSDLRDKQPEGLAVGAFGWVVDLRPSPSERASQGFVHAPSLSQAATAAVLRSGWSAHGTSEADSPLAVNLESSRVRTARWLMDGVRQGQTPGDLLGARFERRLHDAQLDRHIQPLRKRVLQSQDIQREPAGPVDGIDLRNLFAEGKLRNLAPQGSALEGILKELDQWIDSAVDAGTAESVHQLVAGNIPRAAAMLRSLNTGDTRPPELQGLETPRRGPVIENRIAALLDSRESSWPSSPRSRVAPELEAWCADFLGDPARIGCLVRIEAPETAPVTKAITMADLRISALDAVFEVEGGSAAAWQARAEAYVRATQAPADAKVQAVLHDSAGSAVSWEESAQVAAALQALLGKARPLEPADVAAPGEQPEATVDVAELKGRAEALVDELTTWAKRLDQAVRTRSTTDAELLLLSQPASLFGSALAGLAAAVPEASPIRKAAQELLRAGRQLVTEVSRQLRAADKADDPVAACRAAIAEVFGKAMPLPCRFTLDAAAPFPSAMGREKELLPHPGAAELWLRQTSRVRPMAQSLREARDLSTLLGVAGQDELCVAQLPTKPGEKWAAISRPERGTGGRVSFLLTGDAPAGASLTGLFVDGWTERIPDPDQITGVAFHHDSPSQKPPQTLLLATTPEGQSWSLDLVCATLMQTLELAQLRCVTPAHLSDWGHHLPAIHSPHTVDAEAVEEDQD